MIEKKGNLFDTEATILGHGVNCCGVMGAGIAVAFRDQYPDMYQQYRGWCLTGLLKPGHVFPWVHSTGIVLNIASQDKPGANASYSWLYSGLLEAAEIAIGAGEDTVALPRIGCGIGGLDWEVVVPILDTLEEATTVEFEVWTL